MSAAQDSAHDPLRSRFPVHFEVCERILDWISQETNEWRGSTENDVAERILMAIWARTIKTYQAVIRLAAGGFGEQAAMLNRSMFDDFADAAWTSACPVEAQHSFVEHKRFDELYSREIVETKHTAHAGENRTLSDEEREELKHLKDHVYGRHGEKPWTGHSLYSRLKTAEHLWDEAPRRLIWAWYDIAHRRHNAYLHTTPWALEQTFIAVDPDTDAAIFQTGPSDRWVADSLYAAGWTITLTTSVALRHFNADTAADELAKLADRELSRLMTLTREELKDVGRQRRVPVWQRQEGEALPPGHSRRARLNGHRARVGAPVAVEAAPPSATQPCKALRWPVVAAAPAKGARDALPRAILRSMLLGFLALHDSDFGWTALGTLVLAVVTLGGLGFARRSLKATQDQLAQTQAAIEISREEVAQAHRPVLVPVLSDQAVKLFTTEHAAKPWVTEKMLFVPVENVGMGPALHVVAAVVLLAAEGGPHPLGGKGEGQLAGIGAGALTIVEIPVGGGGMTSVPSFLLRLIYADVAARGWVTTARYLFPREHYDGLDIRPAAEGSYGLKQTTELVVPVSDPAVT